MPQHQAIRTKASDEGNQKLLRRDSSDGSSSISWLHFSTPSKNVAVAGQQQDNEE